MTHIERIHILRKAMELQVMNLLEWTELDYCRFKYECGMMYLRVWLHGDAAKVDRMSRNAIFWGWWKMEWFKRDIAYMQDNHEAYVYRNISWNKIVALRIFESMHNVHRLAKEIAPREDVVNVSEPLIK